MSDLDKYSQWIADYNGSIYRRCKEVSTEMKQAFPELIIVRGLVSIVESSKTFQHQWLIAPDGTIIDPTANQWIRIIEYIPIDESDPRNIPTGRCMNCGEWCFGRYDTCSEKCETEVFKYLNENQGERT